MKKDNKLLGSFSLRNIPPGPAGREKFDVTFEINSDGILTVTATHRGNRGNTRSMNIDARTSGRLTEEQVNVMIDQAEKMKLHDETEENRIHSLNRLEALCCRIKFKAKEGNPNDVPPALLKAVSHCLTWIQSNQDASAFSFDSWFDEILEKARTVFLNDEDFRFHLSKSNHVFEMNSANAKNLMDQGECNMKSNNLNYAFECFQKAYMVASRKGRMDRIVAALQKMGHVRRLQVEQGTHMKTRVQRCIDGAIMIAMAIETGERCTFPNRAQREELVGDLQFLGAEFFAGVTDFPLAEMQKATDKFMNAIDISPPIDDDFWSEVMFSCCMSHIKLSHAAITEKLEKDNFKDALNDIKELTRSKEEASRFACTKEDKDRLKSILQQLEGCDKLAMGLMLIKQAEETMNQGEDNSVERAFVALDLLSEAKKLTKQVDMKYFCKAKLFEGKLLLNLFFKKDKAKACFKEVIDISLSERYTDTVWFKEASALFKRIKKEEETPRTPCDEKDDLKKELESELKELDAAERLNHEDFINFLFRKFPPKHHSNPKKPEVQSQNFATLKRALVKLTAYYHPDKVDPSLHGEKHKVLCEEIAKRVNSRYAKLKAQN